MARPTLDVLDTPQDVAGLFALLDEVARGLAREAALEPEERAGRADADPRVVHPSVCGPQGSGCSRPVPGHVDGASRRSGRGLPRPRSPSLRGLLRVALPGVEGITRRGEPPRVGVMPHES
jgi:hypothetical protein